MPALDFQEIATAQSGADRDQFELFARDFLEAEGFEIVRGPDRGPDAGRDLIPGAGHSPSSPSAPYQTGLGLSRLG